MQLKADARPKHLHKCSALQVLPVGAYVTFDSALSPYQWIKELEKLSGSWVVGQAQVSVKHVVGRLSCAEYPGGDFGFVKYSA